MTVQERLEMTSRAQAIVCQMTLEEKVGLMTGCSDMDQLREAWRKNSNFSFHPYRSTGCAKYGVSPIYYTDGPRGIVCGFRESTCFPVPACRAASFDAQLEEEIGAACGREASALGANMVGVCVNLPYHPGWGRAQETYGEDSFLIGKMGAAMVRGIQSESVMACVKHFAFNSMEYARQKVDIVSDARAEREVFLPHFKEAVDAGAACVMGAYNKYAGSRICENDYLVRRILKGEWGFDGIFVGDWFSSIKDTKRAVEAGTDLEMPIPMYYGAELVREVRAGRIDEALIDEAALRIVRTVLAFNEQWHERRQAYEHAIPGFEDHAELARRSAEEGVTLLKNEDRILPFSPRELRRVAVLGKLAREDNLGDHGSGRVFPAHAISLLDGLSATLPTAEIIYYGGDDMEHAAMVAEGADAVIIAAGSGFADEGEYLTTATSPDYRHTLGGDRKSLHLKQYDLDMIRAAGSVNDQCVVVLYGGSSFILSDWIDSVSAVLMAYYPGQEGGTVLADILLGKVNPGGKLPFVIPKSEGNLPDIRWDTDQQHYNYYHGYAKLEKEGIAPHFAFGFGLSYTRFEYSQPNFGTCDGDIWASCSVKNTGDRVGEEVVQLYIGFDRSAVDRPHKLLRGFRRVILNPGQSKEVRIACPMENLKYYNVETGNFTLEHMPYEIYIGSSSDESDLIAGIVEL